VQPDGQATQILLLLRYVPNLQLKQTAVLVGLQRAQFEAVAQGTHF
jgi:hypothetical protein